MPEEAGDLGRVLRTNLAAWQADLDPLEAERRHGAAITTVAFSPDGKVVATGSWADRSVRLWQGPGAEPLGGPIDCPANVHSLAFSPDGLVLAIACRDGTGPTLGHPPSAGSGPTVLAHGQRVNSVAYSHDGKVLATGGMDGQVKLWNAADGRPLSFVLRHVAPSGWSRSRRTIETIVTVTHDGTIRLWDAQDRGRASRPQPRPGRVAVVGGPQPRRPLAGDGMPGWPGQDLGCGEPQLRSVSCPTPTACGRSASAPTAGPSDRRRRQDRAALGCLAAVRASARPPITSKRSGPWPSARMGATSSPAATTASVSSGGVGPIIRVIRELTHREAVGVVAISPDGRIALTGTKPHRAAQAEAEAEVQLWDLATGRPLARLTHSGMVTAASFSPDGRTLATASADGLVRLVDVATGKELCPPLRHEGWVHAVAFDPGGNAPADRRRGRTFARVWEVPTGRYLDRGFEHEQPVVAVAFSPDGSLALTGCGDGTARLWDIASGRERHVFRHGGFVQSVAFSPDGKLILTASMDRTARLWQVSSGEPVGKPLPHQDEVSRAAFSPDGTMVLTASRDNTAQLWSVSTTEPLGSPLVHEGPVEAVAFSPDRATVATGQRGRDCPILGHRHGPAAGTGPPARRSGGGARVLSRRPPDHREPGWQGANLGRPADVRILAGPIGPLDSDSVRDGADRQRGTRPPDARTVAESPPGASRNGRSPRRFRRTGQERGARDEEGRDRGPGLRRTGLLGPWFLRPEGFGDKLGPEASASSPLAL